MKAGTQMGASARDEQQITMGDTRKAKKNRMEFVLERTVYRISNGTFSICATAFYLDE